VLVEGVHPPDYIARGAAMGTFIAFTPTFGFQIAITIFIWTAVRWSRNISFSLPVALAMTWLTNYFTVIPYYFIAYFSGIWITDFVFDVNTSLSYEQFRLLWEPVLKTSLRESLSLISGIFYKIGVPLIIGSLPYAIILSIVAYPLTWQLIVKERAMLSRFKHKSESMITSKQAADNKTVLQ